MKNLPGRASSISTVSRPRAGPGVALSLALCLVLLSAAERSEARMYQWTSPVTGSLQMSGEPPSWYRSGQDGPRVRVFKDGFLVDDTAVDVSVLRRLQLRQEAFVELERRRTLDTLQRVQEDSIAAEERAEPRADAPAAASAEAPAPADSAAPPAGSAEEPLPEELDVEAIERLKRIIAEFDRRSGLR